MQKKNKKLDEFLQINEFGLYSQSIVEMIAREITKKSYRETAKTISEDTENTISHTAVRNIVLKLCEKIKRIEEEKIKLYEEGKIEGNRTAEYVFCEHDGIYVKRQKTKQAHHGQLGLAPPLLRNQLGQELLGVRLH